MPARPPAGARASDEDGFVPDGRSWVSTDGGIWEEAPPHPAMGGLTLWSVVPLPGGGFTAFGYPESPGPSMPSVVQFTSPDGLGWSESAPTAGRIGPSSAIEVPGGMLGFSGRTVWSSVDGINWTEAGTIDGDVAGVAVLGERIVVVTTGADHASMAIQRGVIGP